ncbi:Asp23/Gls24 family envelope stress response protein [Streptomyces sp. MBT55]|uniref:Asp23/Gls24 family envelope stress response protein n=1 Tax=Streptomyces sp. MBT55 TaxID=1488386 RepID=UPI0019121733|nr:Asp23/Gls24 family envelope stress response protein [Streptomyces sp. MBT55]MBK6047001.1 Asp23/Gls24 family envelope stress response protein [Streptomyces sp. MBT55]
MNNPPPETRTDPDDETLPCGRLLSQVWADWEEGVRDDHTAQCAHCRLAVADLERLESQVRALDSDPAQQPVDAASFIDRVMDVVRLELRPGRPLPLGEADEDLRIMENVAARTLRQAAEEIPGVRAGSCRLTLADAPGGTPVNVDLSVHVPLTTPDVPALAQEIRDRVDVTAHERLGLQLGEINVRITDLVSDDDDPYQRSAQEGSAPR